MFYFIYSFLNQSFIIIVSLKYCNIMNYSSCVSPTTCLPSSCVFPTTALPYSCVSPTTSLPVSHHPASLFSSPSSPVPFPVPVLLSSGISPITVSLSPSPPSSLSPTGILDLPDVITPSSRDVSSPPGRSSDVGEQSSKGTSEDTTLPDEDVLGNQM